MGEEVGWKKVDEMGDVSSGSSCKEKDDGQLRTLKYRERACSLCIAYMSRLAKHDQEEQVSLTNRREGS